MKKILAALCLAFCYAPEHEITKGLSGEASQLSVGEESNHAQLSETLRKLLDSFDNSVDGNDTNKHLDGMMQAICLHRRRNNRCLTDHSPSEVHRVYPELNIKQDQGNENLFYVSHPDIKNGQQFRLRFEPCGSDGHVPGLSNDELEKLNRRELSELMHKFESHPYGFKLSYSAKSLIHPARNIEFYWDSDDTEIGNEYWDSDRAINLYELFHSQSLGTLNIEIPYHWSKSFSKQIKSNLETKPDHFGNFVDTIDAVISELKKIGEKLQDPSFGSPCPDKILEQLSDALDKVAHGEIAIKLR